MMQLFRKKVVEQKIIEVEDIVVSFYFDGEDTAIEKTFQGNAYRNGFTEGYSEVINDGYQSLQRFIEYSIIDKYFDFDGVIISSHLFRKCEVTKINKRQIKL